MNRMPLVVTIGVLILIPTTFLMAPKNSFGKDAGYIDQSPATQAVPTPVPTPRPNGSNPTTDQGPWWAYLPFVAGNAVPSITPTPTSAPTPTLNPNAFLETFEGMPINPQPWHPNNWDVTVHSRDFNNLDTLTPMRADHGAQCEAPPATHPINSVAASVFICKAHMMTALFDGDYGEIYLTPNHMVDFSSGTAVIKFDVSTMRNSGRDWIDVWVTPFSDNLQLALDSWLPDLNGPPRRAVHIRMDFTRANSDFIGEIVNNFNVTDVHQQTSAGYETVLTPSASRRDTFELDISNTHLKFGMPQYNLWWIDQNIPNLGWSEGVVQFGHHSYNPEKDCNFDGSCGPNTWHWDNVLISPAIPFTIDRATQLYVNAATGPLVNFATPSPDNAYLRFSGIGSALQVSFDGGVTWQTAQLQAASKEIEEHFKSYWMPIPAGLSQVRFRGKTWWGGDWQARDISIWSLTSK